MQYYAHSVEGSPKSEWQLLQDHARGVAKRAAELAHPLGLDRAAFIAGLLHDLGKYNPEFQRRLEGANISVDHSTAGAQVLRDLAKEADRAMADIIAYAILGHHAGLPDRVEGAGSYDRRMEKKAHLDMAWRQELSPDVTSLMPDLVRRFAHDKDFSLAFMGRMIFSCLVDADFKDTEAFYARQKGENPPRDWASLPDLLPDFIARFDARMAKLATKAEFGIKEDDLLRLRREVLTHMRGKAGEAPGLFTLTVPTGGGKTLASLGFALDHAKHHGHRRIIYAIPFTSIIEQTAGIFREVLGDVHVLEHHSAIDEEQQDERRSGTQKDKLKLAMEDWAAPVIITTNVQLFESLFAARTSRARKLHNIADSILILDEVQALPRGLLLPVLRVLEELATHYGCTIILCTATQPAFGKREDFPKGLPLAGRELAPEPHHLAKRLARTRLRHGGDMDNAALVSALEVHSQALVIVNSRKHALELYQAAKAAGLNGLIHLSTRHYAAQRSAILENVRKRLKDHHPCRLIATSLIEAGVDVDFPVAFRAEAGLDQIIQAAGRVNREGKRPLEASIVTIFSAPDYPPPREIKSLIAAMNRTMRNHDDLTSLHAIEDYFGEVYWHMAEKLDDKKILADFKIASSGSNFNYRTVAEKFRMIESGLAPVIVAREERARKAVEQLGIEKVPSGKLARDLQRYIVMVPPKARDLLITCGKAAFVEPKLRGDQFLVLDEKSKLYQEDVGLLWDDAAYLAIEDQIW